MKRKASQIRRSQSAEKIGACDWRCSSPRAKARGCSTATRRAKTGASTGRIFSARSSATWCVDPRDGRTLLAATKTGHLGPTMMRSTDRGRTWKESKQPPAFAKAPEGEKGRAVDHTFWLTPGHAHEPDVWFAGTSPQGLFRSADGGDTWQAVFDHQRRPAVSRMDGHGAGRHARRPEAAFDHRRSARCEAHAVRHVGRRRA